MLTQSHIDPEKIREMLQEALNEKKYYEDISYPELKSLLMIWQSSTDISPEFFKELISFGERNIVSFENTYGEKITDDKICIRCFKAHLNKKGREFGLSDRALEFLSRPFKCDAGHNEYYLDKEKVMRFY